MKRTAAMLAGLALTACTSGAPDAVPSPVISVTPSAPVWVSASPAPSATTPPAAPARTRYVFPMPCQEVTYAPVHHDYPAADMYDATDGCPFVSPVDGVVHELSRTDPWAPLTDRGEDRGGRFVSVVGLDGVRYYGSHLSEVEPGLRPGTRVHAGTRLGRIGSTGSARGTRPHLHFGISPPEGGWWVRRGLVAPQPYLDAWRFGRQLSPAAEVRRTPVPRQCRRLC